MIKLSDFRIELDFEEEEIKEKICKKLKINKENISKIKILKKSVDARNKNDVHFRYSFGIITDLSEDVIIKKIKDKNISIIKNEEIIHNYKNIKFKKNKPVIVGAGPAGLFCALELTKYGITPILIERGKCVEERKKDVEKFWKSGKLDPNSNVQFGEGGAGTFSDGKLTTGLNDMRIKQILKEFVDLGANEQILYSYKPHIGTDILENVIRNLRNKLISLGVDIRFETKLEKIIKKDGKVIKIEVSKKTENNIEKYEIETEDVVLAIGHSARDTFEMLYENGIFLEQKNFSVGARIEQLQETINKSQYGKFWNHKNLGATDYKLSKHFENGRGAYSFCVCPGGQVVASSSEEGHLVVNGMSKFLRNEKNINGALLVGVGKEDFKSEHPLARNVFSKRN